MEDWDGVNRRGLRRMRFSEPVWFEARDIGLSGGCLASDLSESGIKLNLPQFIPLDKELSLQVHLNSQKVVHCLGRVVWVTKVPFMDRYQTGIEFVPNENIVEDNKEMKTFLSHFK